MQPSNTSTSPMVLRPTIARSSHSKRLLFCRVGGKEEVVEGIRPPQCLETNPRRCAEVFVIQLGAYRSGGGLMLNSSSWLQITLPTLLSSGNYSVRQNIKMQDHIHPEGPSCRLPMQYFLVQGVRWRRMCHIPGNG
ncbi:hypothetical protein EYF80_001562 [Liparis tanakae]|uniref:Uncharacterized protein n=1 Tax=Liparis tanakae TaxID=230148 RepID=A0A4Z2JDM8_9TELE|nr:hypothetical protein EYF80_001562 [Liparis tanakae]